MSTLCDHWSEWVHKLNKAAPELHNALLDAKPLHISKEHVTIGFDPEFPDHMKLAEQAHAKRMISHKLADTLGRPVNVNFNLLADQQELPADTPVNNKGLSAKERIAATGRSAMSIDAQKKWVRHPKVQMVLEAFNGDIKDIRI